MLLHVQLNCQQLHLEEVHFLRWNGIRQLKAVDRHVGHIKKDIMSDTVTPTSCQSTGKSVVSHS